MQIGTMGWVLLMAALAGCGLGQEAPAAERTVQESREMFTRAAAERREKQGQEAPARKGQLLTVPLPGGVLPPFDHELGSDLTSQGKHTTRIVTLRARGIGARDALGRFSDWFKTAGLETAGATAAGDAVRQGFWTPGKGKGVMVVDQGGTHVEVVARDFAPDSESAREGYSALVVLTVNSR